MATTIISVILVSAIFAEVRSYVDHEATIIDFCDDLMFNEELCINHASPMGWSANLFPVEFATGINKNFDTCWPDIDLHPTGLAPGIATSLSPTRPETNCATDFLPIGLALSPAVAFDSTCPNIGYNAEYSPYDSAPCTTANLGPVWPNMIGSRELPVNDLAQGLAAGFGQARSKICYDTGLPPIRRMPGDTAGFGYACPESICRADIPFIRLSPGVAAIFNHAGPKNSCATYIVAIDLTPNVANGFGYTCPEIGCITDFPPVGVTACVSSGLDLTWPNINYNDEILLTDLNPSVIPSFGPECSKVPCVTELRPVGVATITTPNLGPTWSDNNRGVELISAALVSNSPACLNSAWSDNSCSSGIPPIDLDTGIRAGFGAKLAVTSTSPMKPTGVVVTSEDAIDGVINVAAKVPFVGSVITNSGLPASRSRNLAYSCGDVIEIFPETPIDLIAIV